jgi:four helix bundle protein
VKFGYEDLKVWQKAVDFAVEIIHVTEGFDLPRKHYRLIEQLEASSTSVASNIAEGKGRKSKKEYVQFLYIARGSLYETMTFLEVFRRKGWIDGSVHDAIAEKGLEIARMLKGLINGIYRTQNV